MPKAAQIVVGDFSFFAGDASLTKSRELVANTPPRRTNGSLLLVPQNDAWGDVIKHVHGENAQKTTRYAMHKNGDVFDRQKLQAIVDTLAPSYSLAPIDKALYKKLCANVWSRDFCGNFPRYSDYAEHGMGFVALYNGEPVCGASSFSYYNGGIEIEIGTSLSHRRQGLAIACGAKLILECVSRGLYPSWDAANTASVALAQRLGYTFDKEYDTFVVV